jgi:hypothetical protein
VELEAETEGNVEYWTPVEVAPPLGKKILILSWAGSAHIGMWNMAEPDLAWAPLPRIPMHIKKIMSLRWIPDQEKYQKSNN